MQVPDRLSPSAVGLVSPFSGGTTAATSSSNATAPRARTDAASFSRAGLDALAEEEAGEEGETNASGQKELTDEEQQKVKELQARDREVRAHEQAHKNAAGDLATSGPTYEYERGPDGRDYAVGGEVGISMEEGDTPEETLSNAMRIQRAALAPAEPSPQDRRVAADAAAMAAEARAEIQAERQRGEDGGGDPSGSTPSVGSLLDTFA